MSHLRGGLPRLTKLGVPVGSVGAAVPRIFVLVLVAMARAMVFAHLLVTHVTHVTPVSYTHLTLPTNREV